MVTKRQKNTVLGWGGLLLAALFLAACSSSSVNRWNEWVANTVGEKSRDAAHSLQTGSDGVDGIDIAAQPVSVPPGNYTLQGVLEESGASTDGTENSSPMIEPFSATVSLNIAGAITMNTTTTSLNITGISRGQLMGSSISMVLTDISHHDFPLTGTILPLDSSWLSTGSGFSIRAGGTGPSNRVVRVDAVLVTTGAQPIWGNFTPSDQQSVHPVNAPGLRVPIPPLAVNANRQTSPLP
ncbi:MAG: hypothetical protein ACYCTV_08710 [Leptospirales bacterium]